MDRKTEENMVILPIGDRVLVEPIDENTTFAGGLVLPETSEKKPQLGRVIATGTGTIVQGVGVLPLEIFAGAIVIFAKYAGAEVEYGGKHYQVLRESDIFGMILPEEDFFNIADDNPEAFMDRTLQTMVTLASDDDGEEDDGEDGDEPEIVAHSNLGLIDFTPVPTEEVH